MLFMFCILYVFKILNKISSIITMAHILIVQQCSYFFYLVSNIFLMLLLLNSILLMNKKKTEINLLLDQHIETLLFN